MTRLQRLLKAADAMRDWMAKTDGMYARGEGEDMCPPGSMHFKWGGTPSATEFLDALKAFDDVERVDDNA